MLAAGQPAGSPTASIQPPAEPELERSSAELQARADARAEPEAPEQPAWVRPVSGPGSASALESAPLGAVARVGARARPPEA